MMQKSWNDYYSDPYNCTYQGTTYNNQPIAVNSSSFYFLQCVVANYTSTALYFSSTIASTKLLLEESAFHSCGSSGEGGSLYFYTSGQVAQNKITGIRCYADNGQHSYTYM